MTAKANDRRARIIVPDHPPAPAICCRCHRAISALITATTPRNPRPHIVEAPTAYIRTPDGPMCPACHQEECRLVEDAAALAYLLTPVALPSDLPPALIRIYTRNGRVVETEQVAQRTDDAGAAA